MHLCVYFTEESYGSLMESDRKTEKILETKKMKIKITELNRESFRLKRLLNVGS